MHQLSGHPLRAAALLVLVAGTLVAPARAQADTRAQREEVQRERAAVAAQVDTLRATDAQVEAALRTLEGNVQARTAELRDAERQAAAAETALQAATADVAAKEAEIAALDAAVKELAIEVYIRPPSSGGLVDALATSSIGEAELKQTLLEAKSASQLDVLDQLDRAHEDLEVARAAAAAAAAAAEQQRTSVASELDQVTEARAQQAELVVQVQERLDQRLAEAQSLAELDAELAAQIEAEQRRLAEELARQQAAAAARAAAEARNQVRSSPAPAAAPAPAPAAPTTIAITGSGSIVSVRGIRVHQSIADSLAGLLAAAESAGISLAGGGYRDPAGQIAVRRSNCGSSYYAIYQMPASSCSPPTARPGTSMHEQGLAIDFTYGGRVISTRSSPAFQWLAANASRYGLYNLPSEPWHWSVNGR